MKSKNNLIQHFNLNVLPHPKHITEKKSRLHTGNSGPCHSVWSPMPKPCEVHRWENGPSIGSEIFRRDQANEWPGYCSQKTQLPDR